MDSPGNGITVERLPYRLRRDTRRTIARFFWPGGSARAAAIIDRLRVKPAQAMGDGALRDPARLREAENMLRKAHDHPDANSAVALNLALIIGLKGDFEESERIARRHLPPASVEENISYLKKLLAQPARWRRPMEEHRSRWHRSPARGPSP